MATCLKEHQHQTNNRMLRIKEVVNLTGLSKTTLWRLEKKNEFPARKRLSAGAIGYLFGEVDEWIAGRESVVTN